MRRLLILLTFLWSIGLLAQNPKNLGIDNNPILNEDEVTLLNLLLQESRDTFDLANKKVAFITGSNGGTIVTKSDYFNKSIKLWIENDSKPQIFMVKLTESEKIRSGGYDVFVLSWVKIFTPKTKARAISRLGASN